MSPQPDNQAAAPAGYGSTAGPNEFTPEERVILLKLAHESIVSALQHREMSLTPPSPHFAEPRGAFTTIYLHGLLRGCVGYVFPVASIYRTVAETARAAAFDDSRFSPLTLEEAADVEVSLSILSPLKIIRPEEV
ncbi:MAG TPA: AMMECR1 domain-containing protein, partial [Gemmataceae bacterium]|nr:AMMECR1 domain-containing protein [Gemmataceae bacterium]